MILVGLATGVVVVLTLAVTGAFTPASSAALGSSPPYGETVVIIAVGNSWSIPASYYSFQGEINLTSHPVWRVTGAFTATYGVGVYLMLWAQYQAWGSVGVPANYTWSAGSNSTGDTIDAVVQGGQYLLIWDEFSSVDATVVTITESVEAVSS